MYEDVFHDVYRELGPLMLRAFKVEGIHTYLEYKPSKDVIAITTYMIWGGHRLRGDYEIAISDEGPSEPPTEAFWKAVESCFDQLAFQQGREIRYRVEREPVEGSDYLTYIERIVNR